MHDFESRFEPQAQKFPSMSPKCHTFNQIVLLIKVSETRKAWPKCSPTTKATSNNEYVLPPPLPPPFKGHHVLFERRATGRNQSPDTWHYMTGRTRDSIMSKRSFVQNPLYLTHYISGGPQSFACNFRKPLSVVDSKVQSGHGFGN